MANFERAMRFLESGTFQPGTLDYKWWEYYDRLILANATTRYQFFAVPEGQGGKTKSDTNWQVANQMPESERMAVMQFGFYYVPLELRTQAEWVEITDLLKTAYFQFTVYNKSAAIEFPLAIAFGDTMPVLVSGAAAGDQLTTRSKWCGIYELGIEIPLAAKTTVKAEIIFTTAPAADLDGDKIFFSMTGPKWAYGS